LTFATQELKIKSLNRRRYSVYSYRGYMVPLVPFDDVNAHGNRYRYREKRRDKENRKDVRGIMRREWREQESRD